eukprot:4672521-Pleurochrysis_carterae.AAC.1
MATFSAFPAATLFELTAKSGFAKRHSAPTPSPCAFPPPCASSTRSYSHRSHAHLTSVRQPCPTPSAASRPRLESAVSAKGPCRVLSS